MTVSGAGAWASHSTTYALTVLRPSSLTLQCTPGPSRRFISCTGRLTSSGTGIAGAQITLTYQPPNSGAATVHHVTTIANGTFSDTLNAPAGAVLPSGSWQVEAQFGGDGTHA